MLILSLLLGGACGLAASGKYAGAVMMAPALLIVLASTFGRWSIAMMLALIAAGACGYWLLGAYSAAVMATPVAIVVLASTLLRLSVMPLCLTLLAGGAYWTWIKINYRAIEAWEEFMIGFRTETDHAFTEHSGITMAKPNGYFAELIWDEAMPHVRLLLIATPILLLMLGLMRRRRRLALLRDSEKVTDTGPQAIPAKPAPKRDRLDRYPSLLFGWWLLLTIIIYTAAISWSVIPFYRYALPSTFMLYTLAAIAVTWVVSLIGRPGWLKVSVAVIGVTALAAVQWARCADHNSQFANDSHDQLPLWIANNLSGSPQIVADGYTELGSSGTYMSDNVRPSVMRYRWAAEAGSVDDLRNRGVQYVIIASPSYERWINPHGRALEGYEEDFRQKSQFYSQLLSSYPIVMQWKARHPMRTFTNPDMTVFQIDKGPMVQKPQTPPKP
ncbi:MAG: hypothetical protein H7144_12190 [Burkholderiales bacterium]|nr:hypothetical protein [Phycisphaerae bacterium]